MKTQLRDDELLTRVRVAEYLQVQSQTLTVWACEKVHGRPFIKVGRAVRYRRNNLDKWLVSRHLTGRRVGLTSVTRTV